MRDEIALDQAADYYDAVVHADINRVDGIQKNPERVKCFMRSYARNQGGQVPNTVLAQDMAAYDDFSMSEETVASYINALRRIFVVEDMHTWNPNLRSKTAIRSSDTRYYRDKDGQECDAVVHLRNGRYGLIEIKLGGDKLVEEGAKSLKAMQAKIDTSKMKAPSFLMVLTGTGDYAYCRRDDVYVVLIGCLKN